MNLRKLLLRHLSTSTKQVEDRVFFGCFGNPMLHKCDTCDDSNNYKQYLFHMDNYKKLGLDKSPSGIPGYWKFLPKSNNNAAERDEISKNTKAKE
jgi:hypothetical protein